MKKLLITFIGFMMIFCVGCGKQDTDKVIVTVDNSPIYKKEFNERFKPFEQKFKVIKQKDTKKMLSLIYKAQITEQLIVDEIMNNEIEKRNIKVDEKDVDKKIDTIIEKIGGRTKFEIALAKQDISEDKIREDIKKDLKIEKLADSLVVSLGISDGEAKKFYEKNKDKRFSHPKMVRARHILISASEDEIKAQIKADDEKIDEGELNTKTEERMAELRKKAEKVLSKVKRHPDEFPEIAKKYSDDTQSAIKGGDLGFFDENEMVPEFSKAAFSILPGRISGIIQTDFGYHIIKVEDKKEKGFTPYDEVKEEIKAHLKDKQRLEAIQDLVKASKNEAKIEYVDESFDLDNIEKEVKKLSEDLKQKKDKTPKKETKSKKEPVKK